MAELLENKLQMSELSDKNWAREPVLFFFILKKGLNFPSGYCLQPNSGKLPVTSSVVQGCELFEVRCFSLGKT